MGCLFYNELSGERPGYVLAMRIWAFFSKMLAAMVYPGQEDLGLFQQNVSRLVCPGLRRSGSRAAWVLMNGSILSTFLSAEAQLGGQETPGAGQLARGCVVLMNSANLS